MAGLETRRRMVTDQRQRLAAVWSGGAAVAQPLQRGHQRLSVSAYADDADDEVVSDETSRCTSRCCRCELADWPATFSPV